MAQTADVVVVGGGVIGASVAYHLAVYGCRRIRVIDAGSAPGEGSTGRATGGFRAQFGTEINVRLSLLSREKLLRFEDEVGVDPGYGPHGYLFLAQNQATLDALLAAQTIQKAAGLHEAQAVTPDEIREINPAVHLAAVVGGVFCPTDGFIRPLEILRGYTRAANGLGVDFRYGTPCTGFRVERGRIVAVQTPEGEISTPVVVNAAGAWAAAVARLTGEEIPVSPLRRQVASTVPTAALPAEMPMTIFADDGFHLRVRDGRVLLLWPDQPEVTDPFDASFDETWLPEVVARAHTRILSLENVPIDRAACWAGLYEMSPDRHVMLGRAPGVENFYLANGSSGHGVMHAPALGQLLAEIILDGEAPTLDVHPLRPSRFVEGEPLPSAALL